MGRFSERIDYQTEITEIKIRQEAPSDLRGFIVNIALNRCNINIEELRALVCRVLRKREQSVNFTTQIPLFINLPNANGTFPQEYEKDKKIYDLIKDEVQHHLDYCEWYKVYDVIEAIAQHLQKFQNDKCIFDQEINGYFKEHGIGWKLRDVRVEYRGSEALEQIFLKTIKNLKELDYKKSRNELSNALNCLSNKPEINITGAIKHAVSALECILRQYVEKKDKKKTLGELRPQLQKIFVDHPLIPKIIEKIYGFSTETARHVTEGTYSPRYEDAELVVHILTACGYYILKSKQNLTTLD